MEKYASSLDCKEIKPVNPKGNQSWIFIGRTEAEAETPILWPQKRRADSLEKTLKLGKIEGRRRSVQQRTRWLNGITDSMTWVWASSSKAWRTGKPNVCSPWGLKESDMTEGLNNNSRACPYTRNYYWLHACRLGHCSHVWLFVTPWNSPSGSSLHGIFLSRILEWVAHL